MQKTPVYLNELGIVCALGDDKITISERLFTDYTASLTRTDQYSVDRPLPLGQVNSELPSLDDLPPHQQTRSNQLMRAALNQIDESLQQRLAGLDPLRVGVVIGASTSGIAEGEQALAVFNQTGEWPAGFSYRQQEMFNPAETLAQWLGVDGPAFTISTACSSSAKALASARRLLRNDWCDLVIAGGVDALCQLTVNGFSALESVSNNECVPFSANRDGINIGEGAALFVVTREATGVELLGVGETSDAHHISAPAPDGSGAVAAMQMALADADVNPSDIGYLNLHGTATQQNDQMESIAVNQVFQSSRYGNSCPCSSTKGFTGHTLGAAGAIETAFCWLTLLQQQILQKEKNCPVALPVHHWDGVRDDAIAPIDLITTPRTVEKIECAMSNSFAFGGNNISLLLAAVNAQADY